MHKVVRISVIGAVLLLGLIAFVAAQGGQAIAFAGGGYGAVAAVGSTAKVVGGDEAAVRELLARVVGGSPYPDQESIVYVGSLPKELPFDLTLPEGAKIIGSVDYGTPGYVQVMLDSNQTPDDVVKFFGESLTAHDWTIFENYPVGSGFVSEPQSGANYCYKNDQAMLNINAQASDTITHVLLYINVAGEGFTVCNKDGEGGGPGEPYTLLPQLQTPDGVELLPQGSSGGGGGGGPGYRSASVSAYLGSELRIGEIAAAYNQQLQDAGWEAVRSEDGDSMAFSGWTLIDKDGKPWSGTFLLTASPAAENEYLAQVIIQEMPTP
jgi:hypothetical protein